MRIITPTAVLRDWRLADATVLAQYADNPRVAACMRDGFPSPYTLENAIEFISFATTQSRQLLLAIEVDGEAVGGIGVSPLDDVYARTGEIGYWLGEPWWGRGIVTDAVRAVVPIAFSEMGLVRLEAGVFSNNPASMQVLEHTGFVREAVHRRAITKHGQLLDEVIYARLNPDSCRAPGRPSDPTRERDPGMR